MTRIDVLAFPKMTIFGSFLGSFWDHFWTMLPHLGFKRGLQKMFRKMNDFGAPGEGGGSQQGSRGGCQLRWLEVAFKEFRGPVASVTPLPDPPPKRVEIVY